MKRAVSDEVAESRLNLWLVYDGCLLDTIVVSLGKLFGNRKNEALHWEKLYRNGTTAMKEAK